LLAANLEKGGIMAEPVIMTAEEEKKLKEEMRRMEYEPLLPVEKKLITYSIGLGVILLFVFIWLSSFFPGTH
jgi:hypothetical protein